MNIPDPPVIDTDFFTPRNNPPGAVVANGVKALYGIRRYDVIEVIRGTNGGFNEWHLFNGVEFVKGKGYYDQFTEYSFPHPHALYISGDNDAGDRNYSTFDPKTSDGTAVAETALQNKERDCSAGQHGLLDIPHTEGQNIGLRCYDNKTANIIGVSPDGHVNLPLGDVVKNEQAAAVHNTEWALHVGARGIKVYENIVYIRSANYRQWFFRGEMKYYHALANTDRKEFEFQFLSHDYWVMYTPLGAGSYSLYVFQTKRDAHSKLVSLIPVLESIETFPDDIQLDSRYVFISENYMVLPFLVDFQYFPPLPNASPPYNGLTEKVYSVHVYYRKCRSDMFQRVTPEPIVMHDIGGKGAAFHFAHWQNVIMFYSKRDWRQYTSGSTLTKRITRAKLYYWIDGEAYTVEAATDAATSVDFDSDIKRYHYKKQNGTLDMVEFYIHGAASGGRTDNNTTVAIKTNLRHVVKVGGNDLAISNYVTSTNSTNTVDFHTITHQTCSDYPLIEQHFIETEFFEIRLFANESGIGSPIYDSIYFRLPLQEKRYNESRTEQATTEFPAIITTSNTSLAQASIKYAGAVFKPTWLQTLYTLTYRTPRRFRLLRDDVVSLHYTPSYSTNPNASKYDGLPVGTYATLPDGTSICIIRISNSDRWLFFRPPSNIQWEVINDTATDMKKFENLWYSTSSNSYVSYESPVIVQRSEKIKNTFFIGYCKGLPFNDGSYGYGYGYGYRYPDSLVVTQKRMVLAVREDSLDSYYLDIANIKLDDPTNPPNTGEMPNSDCCRFYDADGHKRYIRGTCEELRNIMIAREGEVWYNTNVINTVDCKCQGRDCLDTFTPEIAEIDVGS